jgi:hypothetical protein
MGQRPEDLPRYGVDKFDKNTLKPQNLFAQIVCPSQKVWDFDEKRLH